MRDYLQFDDLPSGSVPLPSDLNKSFVHKHIGAGISSNSNFLDRIRRLRYNKKFWAVSALLLTIVQIQTSFKSAASFRRILCMNGESTPYITATVADARSAPAMKAIIDSMDTPTIPGRRNPPTHIVLCTELLRRQVIHDQGKPITNDFHINEDDAVCRDWSTPHHSLLEIFSNTIIGFVTQKYRITYSHNCQKDKANDETRDGLDWMTAQESLPISSLVLDDGSVSEEQVTGLCKGCISSFNEFVANHPENDTDGNPNPAWFNPHNTHHCILYPGTTRPLINAQHETDMVAVAERRAMAQDVPFAKIIDTIQDRLQLAAVEWKLEHSSVFMTESSPTSEKRSLFEQNARYGSTLEEQNGAVVYLDEDSDPLEAGQYAKFIPSSVETIDILISPLCTEATFRTEQSCIEHAGDLEEYFERMYPTAIISLDVSTSTAAAFSRMILSKYLVCPPGTSACLLPALAKEEQTFAVIAESYERMNTYQYFNFVDNHNDSLQIAQISPRGITSTNEEPQSDPSDEDEDEKQPETARIFTSEGDRGGEVQIQGDVQTKGEVKTQGEVQIQGDVQTQDTSVEDGTSAVNKDTLSAFTDNDYRDGCVELRGRLGSWELDYDYLDLQNEKTQLLRGSSNLDVNEDRFSGENDRDDATTGDFRFIDNSNPECGLDSLTLEGLCEVVSVMELSTITFVGDRYTEMQVKSFWELIGLDADTSGQEELQEGQILHSYRKTAHCPVQNIAFDILFTPNEALVQSVDERVTAPISDVNLDTRYVPAPVNNVYKYYTETTNNHVYENTNTETNNNSEQQYQTSRSNYDSSNQSWSQQPYGSGGYGGYGGWGGGYGGWGGRSGPVAAAPTYHSGCCCVPFQQQYQFNAYGGGGYGGGGGGYGGGGMMNPPPPPMMPAAPKSYYPTAQRQAVVTGLSPRLSYDEYTNKLDDFGRGITDYGNSDDVVILRTGFDTNEASTGGRRANESDSMTKDEIMKANAYMIKSVDEYRRRTKQLDLVSYDPAKGDLPNIHILDVSFMTHSHPHADKVSHGRRNEQVASMYDHWNHLLYSNLRDLAAAEVKRKRSKTLLDTAPEGSPYNSRTISYAIGG